MKPGNGIKLALSALIGFHGFAVLVAPNMESYFGERTRSVVAPYIEFFELSNRWSFFAPDPGPPPVYVEYETADAGGATLTKSQWPEPEDTYLLRERQTRRIAAAEFMIQSGVRIERMMLPYLCGKSPGVASVTLWRAWNPVPSMEEVRAGTQQLHDPARVQRQLLSHSFCPGVT